MNKFLNPLVDAWPSDMDASKRFDPHDAQVTQSGTADWYCSGTTTRIPHGPGQVWVVKANHSRCIELPSTKRDLQPWPSSIALFLQEGSSLEECEKEKLLRSSGCPSVGSGRRDKPSAFLCSAVSRNSILYWYADKRIGQRCRRAAARVEMLVLGPRMVVSSLLSVTSVKRQHYRN